MGFLVLLYFISLYFCVVSCYLLFIFFAPKRNSHWPGWPFQPQKANVALGAVHKLCLSLNACVVSSPSNFGNSSILIHVINFENDTLFEVRIELLHCARYTFHSNLIALIVIYGFVKIYFNI